MAEIIHKKKKFSFFLIFWKTFAKLWNFARKKTSASGDWKPTKSLNYNFYFEKWRK
jgi:hypothetical protein